MASGELSSSLFPLLHSSSFSVSMSSFLILLSFVFFLCFLYSSLSLFLLPLCSVYGILNSRCLSSQRAPSLCLPVLFERLIFSSIREELSRAKVFSIMLLTHIKKGGEKLLHSKLNSFMAFCLSLQACVIVSPRAVKAHTVHQAS